MAGVPGAFWRCPAVLWGPSTQHPAWVAGKPLILKNWPIFPMCMWKWAGSAPSGQARLWRPNGHQCAKSHAGRQAPSSIRFFSFSTLFRALRGDFSGFSPAGHILWLAHYLAVPAGCLQSSSQQCPSTTAAAPCCCVGTPCGWLFARTSSTPSYLGSIY